MEEDRRNFIVFFVVSMLIMVGYPYFLDKFFPSTTAEQRIDQGAIYQNAAPQKNGSSQKSSPPARREEIKNIQIETENIQGIISSRGVRISDIRLKKYKKKAGGEERVQILSDGQRVFFAETRWTSNDPLIILPNQSSCWKADSIVLSEDAPVTLTWDNGNGLLFEKQISIDRDFLITIVEKVRNIGPGMASLSTEEVICREQTSIENSSNFYNGPLGYVDNKLEEVKYEDIAKRGEIVHHSIGGWFGITDEYWLTAFIPNQRSENQVIYSHSCRDGRDEYTIKNVSNTIELKPGEAISKIHRLFVGAKEINTLDRYEEQLAVKHFDLAIDFGYLYMLTKPLLYLLAYTKGLVGNMGIGILLITLLIKLLLFPLASKSYRSMNRMSAIQPKIQELQKKYAGDNVKLGQAVSDLYKKERINPVGGCLPLLLQSPVLYALYKVLYISIEIRQEPFFGWIDDLSQADPLSILNLFEIIPINLPSFLQIGVCPVLMGLTMWLQQKMSPPPANPQQANMLWIMPVLFTVMFARLPAGLIIYWTFSNILGILQQYVIKRRSKKERCLENQR
ncbi:MAG: membrane protein insertase YidC [Holosporaceae bacterium]|jgi:YidC/Oxa1 family membrane protein insertase|nr:membrane protein insertase YidC [Holosporaceae bacterium]